MTVNLSTRPSYNLFRFLSEIITATFIRINSELLKFDFELLEEGVVGKEKFVEIDALGIDVSIENIDSVISFTFISDISFSNIYLSFSLILSCKISKS